MKPGRVQRVEVILHEKASRESCTDSDIECTLPKSRASMDMSRCQATRNEGSVYGVSCPSIRTTAFGQSVAFQRPTQVEIPAPGWHSAEGGNRNEDEEKALSTLRSLREQDW